MKASLLLYSRPYDVRTSFFILHAYKEHFASMAPEWELSLIPSSHRRTVYYRISVGTITSSTIHKEVIKKSEYIQDTREALLALQSSRNVIIIIYIFTYFGSLAKMIGEVAKYRINFFSVERIFKILFISFSDVIIQEIVFFRGAPASITLRDSSTGASFCWGSVVSGYYWKIS